MASNWSVTTKGFDTLEAQLSKLDDPALFRAAMTESLILLRNEASRFPPQPSRTRSRTFNTWVREVGRLPRSAFGISSKTGKVTIRNRRGGVLFPSEKLLAKWKEAQPQISASGTTVTGKISNAVSYAPYVQGDQQASFHAQTGWRTTQDILKANEAKITAIFEKALTGKVGG